VSPQAPRPAPAGLRRTARVAGVVLAAGAGTRFGGPKALAELDGERLVDRAARVLRAGGCDPVLVVLGAAEVDVPGADAVVVNDDWSTGMGSSLRAALAAPDLAGCSAAVLVLVDQPGIRASAVRAVADAHRAGADLAVARYEDGTGHPVLLGRSHWAGVAEAAEGDVGARPYLAAHADEVVTVDCTGHGDARDADTPVELTGRGFLSRIAGDTGAAVGGGIAGIGGELNAFAGGAAARAALEERQAQQVRRETQESGEPPFRIDLDSGVVRLARPPAEDPARDATDGGTDPESDRESDA
jgi:CTP:molybdopterin cytidylyltransferase MocA